MKIPWTAKALVESMLRQANYSITNIAKELGLNRKTIYATLKGKDVAPETNLKLIGLYMHLRLKNLV